MQWKMNLGRRAMSLAVLTLLLLGACSEARKGAGIGAVVGAATGAVAGDTKGAVIGAAVGATAGALIGDYMAKQKAELEKVPGADVRQEGDDIVVSFNSPILFDTDSSRLKPQSQSMLKDISRVLMDYPDTDIVIMGHTDSVGAESYNQKLSERRAKAVFNYLVFRGVAPSRLKSMGFGESMPLASNDSASGRTQNRRVEMQIAANSTLRERAASSDKGR